MSQENKPLRSAKSEKRHFYVILTPLIPVCDAVDAVMAFRVNGVFCRLAGRKQEIEIIDLWIGKEVDKKRGHSW